MVTFLDPHRTTAEKALQAVLAGADVEEVESRTFDCKEEEGTVVKGGKRVTGSSHNDAAARDLAEASACFANAAGGAILLGVNDKEAGVAALVGASLEAEWLKKRIWDLTTPHLTVDVQELEERGVRLLLILVQAGTGDLIKVGRKLRHRIRKDCVEMTPADQRIAIEDRSGYDWSAQPTAHVVREVSPAAMERTREYLRQTDEGSRRELAESSTPELLRKLNLLDGDGHLNRAGALLLVAPKEDDLVLLDYKRRRVAGGDSVNRLDRGRPLIEAYHDVKQAIDAGNELRQVSLPSGVRPQIRIVPDTAVREAIVNGLIHRDYRLPGPVDIEFVGDQLVVDSPGGFLTGIDERNILSHPSKLRNTVLTGFFRALRLAEWEGVGVDRMYREMIKVGHALPQITDTGGRVRCVLLGGEPVEPIVQLTAGLSSDAQQDVDIALVIFQLLKDPFVTSSDLAPLLQKTEAEATAAIRRAEKAGLVVGERGEDHGVRTRFRFTDAVRDQLRDRLSYVTTSAAEAEEHVVRHLLNHERIAVSDAQGMFGVQRVQASRILRALRDDDILEYGSKHDRGPGVFYVRGPAFDQAKRRHA